MKPLLLLESSPKDLTRNDEGGIQADVSLIYVAEVLKTDPRAAEILRPSRAGAAADGPFVFVDEAASLMAQGMIGPMSVGLIARELDRMACRAQGAASIMAMVDRGGREHRRMKDLADLLETLAEIWVRASDPSLAERDRVALLKGRSLASASLG